MTNWSRSVRIKIVYGRVEAKAADRSRRNTPKTTKHGRQHRTAS